MFGYLKPFDDWGLKINVNNDDIMDLKDRANDLDIDYKQLDGYGHLNKKVGFVFQNPDDFDDKLLVEGQPNKPITRIIVRTEFGGWFNPQDEQVYKRSFWD